MSATKAVFVLIHGGWHNHSAWASFIVPNGMPLPAMLQPESPLAEQSAEAPQVSIHEHG